MGQGWNTGVRNPVADPCCLAEIAGYSSVAVYWTATSSMARKFAITYEADKVVLEVVMDPW